MPTYAVTPQGEYRFTLDPEKRRLLEAHYTEKVTLGIRPQHIGIEQKAGYVPLSGKGALFEFLGECGYFTINNQGLDLSLLTPADTELHHEQIDIFYDWRISRAIKRPYARISSSIRNCFPTPLAVGGRSMDSPALR